MNKIRTMAINNIYIKYQVVFNPKEDIVYVPKDKSLYAIYTEKVRIGGVKKTIAKKRKLNLFDLRAIAADSLWAERQGVLMRLNMDPNSEKDNPLIWVQPEDLVEITYSEMLGFLEPNEKVVFFNCLD